MAPEFAVLVPLALVCQYHVWPAGAEPLLVRVTPGDEHCGELDVGLAGFAGRMTTVPFTVTSSLVQCILPDWALIMYKRKVTAFILVKSAAGRFTVGV